MLSFQILSVQIDVSWSKKPITKDKIERHIHANKIEKKINDMKYKSSEYIRFI